MILLAYWRQHDMATGVDVFETLDGLARFVESRRGVVLLDLEYEGGEPLRQEVVLRALEEWVHFDAVLATTRLLLHLPAQVQALAEPVEAPPGSEPARRLVRVRLWPASPGDRSAGPPPAGAAPEDGLAALPESLRARRVAELDGLTRRALNLLRREGVATLGDLARIPPRQLRRWRGLGPKTLENLRAGLRSAIEQVEGARATPGGEDATAPDPPDSSAAGWASGSAVSTLAAALPIAARGLGVDKLLPDGSRGLRPLLASGCRTIGDLVTRSDADLAGIRGLGEQALTDLCDGLASLRERLAALPRGALRTSDTLRRHLATRGPLRAHVQAYADALDKRSRRILSRRVLAPRRPTTLAALGRELGITRERVRQIEARALRRMDPHGDLAFALDARLLALRQGRRAPLRLADLEARDPWFSGCSDWGGALGQLLAVLGCEHRLLHWAGQPPFLAPHGMADLAGLTTAFQRDVPTGTRPEAVPALVQRFLAQRGAAELTRPFLDALPPYVASSDGVRFRPTLRHWVENVLLEAGRPLRIPEIEKRLRALAVPFTREQVRRALNDLPVITTARGLYTVPALLTPWLEHAAAVRAELRPLMEAHPERQWTTRELRTVLADAGHSWVRALPEAAVAYILACSPQDFRRLGRGCWVSAHSPVRKRQQLAPLAAAILEEHGGPMSRQELTARVRVTRGLSRGLTVRWPLVSLAGGNIGLGPRDLGLSAALAGRIRAQATAARQAGRRLTRLDVKRILGNVRHHGALLDPNAVAYGLGVPLADAAPPQRRAGAAARRPPARPAAPRAATAGRRRGGS